MTLRIFTLCDGAYNYNGKLTIVGTTDNIKVSQLPADINIGIAIKASFSPNEYGDKAVSVKITDGNNNPIIPGIEIPKIEVKGKNGEEGHFVIAGNLQGLKITREGEHRIELSVDNKVFYLPFKIFR